MAGRWWLILPVLAVCALMSGCSGRASAESIGDPDAGRALFHQTAIRQAPACSTCHSVEPGGAGVGPSLAGVAGRSAGRDPRLTAPDYLRQSILDPNAYVVAGYSPGVMYADFSKVLTDAEVRDLVAYLLTLK